MLNPEKRTFTFQGRRVVEWQEVDCLPEALRAVGLPAAPRVAVFQVAAAALEALQGPALRRVARLARAVALRVVQRSLFHVPHKRCDRCAEPAAIGAE